MLPEDEMDFAHIELNEMHILFKKMQTFKFAREIWLYCQDHGFKVPDEVSKMFVEGIRKQVQDQPNTTKEKQRKKGKKIMEGAHLLAEIEAEIIKQAEKNEYGSDTRAYEMISIKRSNANKNKHKEKEAIKQFHHRMKKDPTALAIAQYLLGRKKQ